MKPDWKDAPEWAKWLACDSCGLWAWYQYKPCKGKIFWKTLKGISEYDLNPYALNYSDLVKNKDWESTLESRPK